ncbi:hypothetical protein GobsT_07920 [Gemmata obscuriglobus]|uniref:Uncharacterized protein n=1 Tax=Gemmata obscuriglobus TaxID=114 RepID=A0A2Z3HAY5_9BACT|nr:hypothetical protein [Gemmata obscuriglobus]AWM40677.1 hypothetical protein C1280_29295 [Gemmata obscuriglobus]QEG26057.1 hypothetical protein GobsT_07920 [Gemmata obscuriglobus]VTS00454.1 unnamed protein product [Gemmata obscuriglobus UQM 2246]
MGARYSSLTAVALGALAIGTGCLSTEGKKPEVQKLDVMKPGVLPPPQETTRTDDARGGGAPGPVVQASATAPVAATTPAPVTSGAPAAAPANPLAKLGAKLERKVVASDFAVGWQNRIAYLPDPTKNGRMNPGVVGHMFLYSGSKMEFAQADGVLTVDLVDDSPRPPGQSPATPERWQFDKATLRNLQARDETFGQSYKLFLPWPTYKPDITRVKISARYDPESGPTLFSPASTITFDTSAPFGSQVWEKVPKERVGEPLLPPDARAFGNPTVVQSGPPIPLGGSGAGTGPMIPIRNQSAPAPMMPILGGAAPIAIPNGQAPMMPIPNGPLPIPGREGLGAPSTANTMPLAPSGDAPKPGDVPQITTVLPIPSRP